VLNNKEIKSLAEIILNSADMEKIRDVRLKYKVVEEFLLIFPEFAEFVIPVKYNKKILSLRVENSVMRQELNLRQEALIEKINKYYQKEVVNKIKFV
jgi:trehalose-6-phosphate synthase